MTKPLPVHVTVVIPTRNEEEAIVDTIRSVPNDGWCDRLDFLIIDGNSTDSTRELAKAEGATVYLEPRKGYGRAYKTGFSMAPGDIIVTMDADCTYPGEEVPGLVRKLVEEDLSWITCDRLRRAEQGSMPGLHGFGNWVLSTTASLCTGMGYMTPRVECGFSEDQSSMMRGSVPSMTECLSRRSSKSGRGDTLARRELLRSVFHTGLGSGRLRSTLGGMAS